MTQFEEDAEHFVDAAEADIEYSVAENEQHVMQDCVRARCAESGDVTAPVWGRGFASVRRALALLTETCSCGMEWHEER